MFSYKIHKRGEEVLLAISDSSIIGKKFKEGEITLDIDENFYSENICDEEKAVEMIGSSTIINIVGKEIVNALIEKKVIDKNNILWVQGVPHAQIIKML